MEALIMTQATIIFLSVVCYLLIMNLWAFFAFGADKRSAKKHTTRTPERHLLRLAWLGGGLGAWLGMRLFEHKTLHLRFRVAVPLVCILWLFPTGSVTAVYALRSGPVHYTVFMLSHGGTRDCRWVNYEDINPSLTRAVMASEDNLFPSHHGFSQRGLQQAYKELREKGKVRHGGSTISQQTAKNVFTSGKRTWLRKARETWYTVLIETFWTKQRIMEVYLNVIEWGNGIYGAEAAAQHYFHHSAKRLTNEESALLAACLPAPRRYSVTHPGPYVRRRQQQIINLMPKLGPIYLFSSPAK